MSMKDLLLSGIVAAAALALSASATQALASAAASGTPAPTPTSAQAPAPSSKLTTAEREFVAAFIAAANARSIDTMRKLVVPEDLACYDKDTRIYLDNWLRRQVRYEIPPDHQVSFLRFYGELRRSRRSQGFTAPVQPTAMMILEFTSAGGQKARVGHQVREENGKLYLIAPCPNQEGIEQMRAEKMRRDSKLEKARDLYANLADPLRSQLTSLLKQNDYDHALRLCSRSLKIDGLTARYVLDLVAGREPGSGIAAMPSAAPTSHR
jgi:hypothetical protein